MLRGGGGICYNIGQYRIYKFVTKYSMNFTTLLLRVFVISMRLVENTGVSLDPLYHIDFLGIGEFSGDALDGSAIRQKKTKFIN